MQHRSIVLVEFTPSGGLFQFAVQLGEALARRGHQVSLLTGESPELTSRVPGFRVRPLLPTWHPAAGATAPRRVRKVRRVVRAGRYIAAWLITCALLIRERPDVVQWASFRFPMDGWFVRRLAQLPGIRTVWVDLVHAPRPFNEQNASGEIFRQSPAMTRQFGAAYRTLDAVMVLGERSKRDMAEAWPGLGEIAVIPHGDEGIFTGPPVPPAEATEPVALFFGTLTTYKGLDLLLDAFAIVHSRLPDTRLVIAGAPSADIDLSALTAKAAAVGAVEIRPGYVPIAQVGELFGAARVVVAPYRYANASGVVHLAQTFHRPVVATDVGDLAAAVVDGETGRLVKPDSPVALAQAIEEFLRDRELAGRLGRAGQRRLVAGSGWDSVAAAVEAVYEACLTDPAALPG